MKQRLIREFTEFNHMRLSKDSVPQSTHVDNPDLSLGSYNRFELNLRSSLDKLNGLFKSMNLTSTGVNLTTGDKVDASDIQNIKILRIFPKNDIYLNVYFTFEIEEKEYYGVIKGINHPNTEVNSEVFRDRSLFTTKEWEIRIKGNIIKAIKQWMNVQPGKYLSLKDIDGYNENTGQLTLIPSNSQIDLKRTMENEILINYQGDDFLLKGKNFYYFNYYFEPIRQKKKE